MNERPKKKLCFSKSGFGAGRRNSAGLYSASLKCNPKKKVRRCFVMVEVFFCDVVFCVFILY